jgi:hypothetical protein
MVCLSLFQRIPAGGRLLTDQASYTSRAALARAVCVAPAFPLVRGTSRPGMALPGVRMLEERAVERPSEGGPRAWQDAGGADPPEPQQEHAGARVFTPHVPPLGEGLRRPPGRAPGSRRC